MRSVSIEERATILAHYIIDKNKAERHIRGGLATKLKYSHKSLSQK